MSEWTIRIIVALISASAVIIAALIGRDRKKKDTLEHQKQKTGVVQNLTVNVNIGDEDTIGEQSNVIMDNNIVASVGKRRRKNPFLASEEDIKKASIKDPQYFEKVGTYLAESRNMDEFRIARNKTNDH